MPMSNPYRVGTFEYEDYNDYLDTYATDRKFHVERIERGKKIRKETIWTIVKVTALSAICAVGTIFHGVDFFNTLFTPLEELNMSADHATLRALADVVVPSITGTAAFYGIKDVIIAKVRKLKAINREIDASKSMAEILPEKEGNTHGL